jgi:flagellar FliL protein
MASTIEHQTDSESGPSMVAFLIACAVITLVAAGAGFGVSATMIGPATFPSSDVANDGGAASGGGESGHGAPASGHGAESADTGKPAHEYVVVDIPSITTNLVDPSDAWIRMELSLVFTEKADQEVAMEVHQDILAYVHTMKLYNLRGGSGYQHLIEDLQERAAIRTEGRVKRVLVRSLILE